MAEKRKPQTGLEWLNQNYGMGPVNELLGLAGGFGRNMEQLINRAGGYAVPSGLTPEQQQALAASVEGADARVARIKQESDALVDAARKDPSHQFHGLFTQQRPVISDDVDARESEKRRMLQQYAPGADLWSTDAGKEMIQAAQANSYEGDAAGLPGYYANQRNVGTGAMPEIIDAMGYTGDMAKWAEANPALAMREYNKKFGDSYAGTGPSDAEIQAAMDEGRYFPSEGCPNPLGKTGEAREINNAGTAQAQNGTQQQKRELALDQIQQYIDSSPENLRGKRTLGNTLINLMRRKGQL